jgi:small subunit ribosomal protein S18
MQRNTRRNAPKRKVLNINVSNVDYKDVKTLQKFLTSQYKIGSNKRTNLSKQNQRKIAKAIKLARQMGLMPYTREQKRKTIELSQKHLEQ